MAPRPSLLQSIDISCQRTFQQAPTEPMGDDTGAGELRSLLAAQGATATAVRHSQSNADPAVAAIRNHLSRPSSASPWACQPRSSRSWGRPSRTCAARQRAWLRQHT